MTWESHQPPSCVAWKGGSGHPTGSLSSSSASVLRATSSIVVAPWPALVGRLGRGHDRGTSCRVLPQVSGDIDGTGVDEDGEHHAGDEEPRRRPLLVLALDARHGLVEPGLQPRFEPHQVITDIGVDLLHPGGKPGRDGVGGPGELDRRVGEGPGREVGDPGLSSGGVRGAVDRRAAEPVVKGCRPGPADLTTRQHRPDGLLEVPVPLLQPLRDQLHHGGRRRREDEEEQRQTDGRLERLRTEHPPHPCRWLWPPASSRASADGNAFGHTFGALRRSDSPSSGAGRSKDHPWPRPAETQTGAPCGLSPGEATYGLRKGSRAEDLDAVGGVVAC